MVAILSYHLPTLCQRHLAREETEMQQALFGIFDDSLGQVFQDLLPSPVQPPQCNKFGTSSSSSDSSGMPKALHNAF